VSTSYHKGNIGNIHKSAVINSKSLSTGQDDACGNVCDLYLRGAQVESQPGH
jgi:hypothetical protein